MDKKGSSTGAIISVIMGIIFLIVIMVIIIIAVQKGKTPDEIEPTKLKLYLMAVDNETKINANYSLDYTANGKPIVFSQGKLGQDFTEIENVFSDRIIHARVYSEDYYMIKASTQFTQQEVQSNVSKFVVDMIKIGDMEITHIGNLNDELNRITFNITSKDGWIYKLSAVFSWTPGIIDVYLDNQMITCEEGTWLNYSNYDSETKIYTYLENNYYKCGEDSQEQCEKVIGNKCKLLNSKIPYRFLGKYDSAIYTGKTLKPGETYQLTLNVKTQELKTVLDELKITFYDRDRRWNPTENMFTWESEIDGVNIGAEDVDYLVRYK